MGNYKCVEIEYLPIKKEKKKQMKMCIDRMQDDGYNVKLTTDISYTKTLLVFCK